MLWINYVLFIITETTEGVNFQDLQWSQTIIPRAQSLLCLLQDFQDTFELQQAVIIRIRIADHRPQLLPPQVTRQGLAEKFAHSLLMLV